MVKALSDAYRTMKLFAQGKRLSIIAKRSSRHQCVDCT